MAVLLALGLLVESFERQVHWRWRTRHRAGTRALVNVRRAGVTGLRTAAGMALWPSPTRVRAAYGTAVEYSLRSLLSFVTHHADRDTVLVVLGDHQPATIVSGRDAVHDVPVTIIARDRSVLAAIDGWHWSPGLIPAREGQAWRMDRFRDRFLAAFAR